MSKRKSSFDEVEVAVRIERGRQYIKWGLEHDSRHSLGEWLDILRHELEEACLAPTENECLTEILHVLAVGTACLEWHGVPERR